MLRSTYAIGLFCLATLDAAAQEFGALSLTEPSLPLPTPTLPVESPDTFLWTDGFRLVSADEEHQLRIGGRFDLDGNWRGGSGVGPEGFEVDTVGLRRSRLLLEGRSYGAIGYRAVIDFSGPNEPLVADRERDTAFADLYLTLDNFLVGRLRAGQFFEPFGLEANTYSEAIPFQERSDVTRLIAPGRGTGLMLDDQVGDSRLHWALGVFATRGLEPTDGDELFAALGGDAPGTDPEQVEGNYAVTARIAHAPYMADGGRELIHVGASISNRGTALATTGGDAPRTFDDDLRFGVEAAAVFGAFSFQTEYLDANSSAADGGPDLEARGVYAQVAWMLTGETRAYRDGAFLPIEPDSIWRGFGGDGRGAFEAALRFSSSRLDVGQATEADTLEAAFNWYLNPNVRVMLGFQTTDSDAGDLDAINLRWQLSI